VEENWGEDDGDVQVQEYKHTLEKADRDLE
jgi:hypothetical protein